jgi:CheY-like chemotaxis protein
MVSQKLLAKRVGAVETAENGSIGLEKIRTTRYDLILSDYFMPVMDGAEMIRQVRQAGITTPIISVTAAVLGEEAKELRDAGANQILAKPISMKGFIDSVEQLL